MKLVRDKIPEIIEESGGKPLTEVVTGDDYQSFLKEKLQEEVTEFLIDNTDEELADILEVIYTLADKDVIEQIRLKKREERGGFEKGIVLKEVQ